VRNDDMLKGIVDLSIFRDGKFIPKVSSIFFEISGGCNAECPYCARQRFKQRYSGKNISPVLFEKILEHLLNIGLLHRDHNQTIQLYIWGEPSLNPEINDILKVLQKHNLSGGISSNFIEMPKIDKDTLPMLRNVTFSLSGFSQDSYGKIHGASLKRVLGHFEDFYEQIRKYAPNTSINIAWHRYTFNELELWEAYKYFHRPSIRFSPTVALLIDFPEMLSYTEGGLSEDRQRQAGKDLFLNHISQGLAYHKKRSKDYHCSQWNYLVIDEIGQLLLCCNLTNNNLDNVLGNVLKMSAEDIWQKKLSGSICKTCILSGVPRAFNPIGNKPLPTGGNGSYFKLWYELNLSNGFFSYVFHNVVRIVRDLPGGDKIVRMIRTLRDKVKGTRGN